MKAKANVDRQKSKHPKSPNSEHPKSDPAVSLKKFLREHGITYDDVAKRAGVTWWMVWAVLNGRRRSAPVIDAIRKLLENSKRGT